MFGFSLGWQRVVALSAIFCQVSFCVYAEVAGSVLPLDKNTIVIGQSAPLTGANAALGLDIRRGALSYFNSVNAKGGINGKMIELISLDDSNEALLSGRNALELIDNRRAIALFGFASATLASPALPIVQKHGMAMFAPVTGADAIHNKQSPVFTVRASYRDEMAAMMKQWQPYIQDVAVVHYDDTVGFQNYQAVQDLIVSSGGKLTSIPIKRNQLKDLSAVKLLLQKSPQLVIFTTSAEPIANIVRELKKTNRYFNFSSLSFAGNNVLKDLLGVNGAGVSMTTVVPLYSSGASPLLWEYGAAMRRDGFELSYTSLESYIAAKTLVEGLKRAGNVPTRQSLVHGLESIGRLDLGGYFVTFGPNAHHGSTYVDMVVIGSNGRFK